MEERSNSRRRIVRIIIISVLIIILFTVSRFYKPMIVVSGSMLPVLQINSMTMMKYCGTDDVEVGDIAVYRDNDRGINIVHRVIEKSENEAGEPYLTFKGDANPIADFVQVTDDMMIGKVVGIYNEAAPFVSIFISGGVLNKTRTAVFILIAAAVLNLLFEAVCWMFDN